MFLIDFFMVFFSFFILFIFILLGVAFLTLLERKVLGYIQIRKGPNKVGFMGVFQPFSDAIKLFSKEQIFPFMSNFNIYYLCPFFNLLVSLFLWICLPFFSMLITFSFSILFFFCISSFGVYMIMLAGWSSNSSYSLLGSLRSVAQSISYEVSFGIIMLSLIYLTLDYSFFSFFVYQKFNWMVFFTLPLFYMWFISSLAETNRTPFDFSEGESELVSGFNVEYSGGGFALLFLSEYSNILFMSFLCTLVFMGINFGSLMFFVKVSLFSFLWVWIRGTLPRFRYDKLMYLSWKSFLPCSLNLVLFYLSLKFFFLILAF